MELLNFMPDEVKDEFNAGNGVIFFGAGASIGSGLPSWESLIREMGQYVVAKYRVSAEELKNDLDYLEIAQLYRSAVGDDRFFKFLRRTLHTHYIRPSSPAENRTLSAIADVTAHFWPRPGIALVTTNYDTLLQERLLQRHGIRVRPMVTESDLATMDTSRELTLLKPHGDIDNPESIVLTLEDYYEFRSRKPEFFHVMAELFARKTVLFVGYGHRDFTFNVMLAEIKSALRRWRRKAYAISTDVRPIRAEILRTIGVELISVQSNDEIPGLLKELLGTHHSEGPAWRGRGGPPEFMRRLMYEANLLYVAEEEQGEQLYNQAAQEGWDGFTLARDPQQAVSLLERLGYDIVIIDRGIAIDPDHDLLRYIRSSPRNRSCIVALASDRAPDPGDYSRGADILLKKPLRLDNCISALFLLYRVRAGCYAVGDEAGAATVGPESG